MRALAALMRLMATVLWVGLGLAPLALFLLALILGLWSTLGRTL
jgi:hypothetical protein